MLVLHSLPHLNDEAGEEEALWTTVATLWHEGIEPRWPRVYDGQRRLRVRLPTYSWDHGRYWLGRRDEETLESHEFVPRGAHARQVEFTPPRNEFEAGVVEIFQELFGVPNLGIYHNFFHLGGDSLLAVQLAGRIRDRWGVQIPLRQLWAIRTAAEVALIVARGLDPAFAPEAAGFEAAESKAESMAEPQPA
jgi:acyl carrier protein